MYYFKNVIYTFCVAFSVRMHSFILSPPSSVLYTKNVKLFSTSPPPPPNTSSKCNIFTNHLIPRSGGAATAQPEMVKVLLNACHGGFGFSNVFKKEYEKIYNVSSFDNHNVNFYDPFLDKEHKNENIESRYDWRIIELFEILGGSSVCSGSYADLRIKKVPRQLIPYMNIAEYDGAESLFFSMSKMYKELLDELMENRYIKYYDVLKYQEISAWEKYLKENNIQYY